MELESTTIEESVQETWSCVFGLRAERLDEPIPHGVRKRFLSAVIQVTGEWMGSVIIDYEPDLARRMASEFSSLPVERIAFPQMRDVLGETVNIVAGNIKAHLPAGCHLSLPTVITGMDYRLLVTGAQVAAREAFRCEAGRFQVTVFEVAPEGGDAGTADAGGAE